MTGAGRGRFWERDRRTLEEEEVGIGLVIVYDINSKGRISEEGITDCAISDIRSLGKALSSDPSLRKK